ncbi:insulin-like growth factor-binding protein 3 [Hypomesus transpacificus]|uniref:insulin-like growth factor-binding protein 3 n=1 Tax=Hypomesus transpacificus TaxID=137520 RepID=UPI001F081FAF|nr:insulin-like growth factor-binding protein 3 [Hypomesus transpacificus]
MLLYLDILALVFLQLVLSSSWTLASRLPPLQECLSCEGSRGIRAPSHHESVKISTTTLALGEPCGVYTLSCAQGLRCSPPQGDISPLQALLQGRGVCCVAKPRATEKPKTTETADSIPREVLEKAPCRRLLVSILKGLEPQVFLSDRGIYMPNCDRNGFFRKKQCQSSKGMQRGNCWCVDDHGLPMLSRTRQDGTLHCDKV